jgi:hypothetical protein
LSGATRWLREYGRATFYAPDCLLGLLLGGLVAVVAILSDGTREQARAILFAELGLAGAFLAIVLTCLAIVVTFFDEQYRLLLQKLPSGVRGAFMPYVSVACVAAAATCAALIGAAVWPALSQSLQVLMLLLTTWLSIWTILGTLDLVRLAVFHGMKRAELLEIISEASGRLRRSA